MIVYLQNLTIGGTRYSVFLYKGIIQLRDPTTPVITHIQYPTMKKYILHEFSYASVLRAGIQDMLNSKLMEQNND
jgi:hypothetical protein